jgi:hypothetical protein
MKSVLKDHPCYLPIEDAEVFVNGVKEDWSRELPFVSAWITLRNNDTFRVEVNALIDTGADVTIFNIEKLRELEKVTGERIQEARGVNVYGHNEPQPAFELAFVFPGGHSYSSRFGLVAPADWDFDVADLWLGQDILRQLVVIFDGTHGTVSITDLEEHEGCKTLGTTNQVSPSELV